MKKRFNLRVLVICFLIVFGTAFVGSLFTSKNVDTSWYQNIKPDITPPNYVFPIVWNILFFLIALSLYFAWIYSSKDQKKKIVLVYGINLFLNAFWSFVFFGLKLPLYAFGVLILLEFSIISMIYVTYKINKKFSYFLIPYLLWVSFAGILNYFIAT